MLVATIVKDIGHKDIVTTMAVNPQLIVLLVFSALFAVFSTGMFFTHLILLSRNASTVEWHSIQNMREQEQAFLSTAFPACECLGMGHTSSGGLLGAQESEFAGNPSEDLGIHEGYRGRKQLRKKWDEEWGRIGKEGNLWW
jgi:palmitoyltransferase